MEINNDIWVKVQSAFAEVFGYDDEEIEFDAKIIEDLEAESLDFLDIAFRLERAFNIKIPRGGIEQAAREGVDGDGLKPDGTLTAEALQRLKEAMPEVPVDEFKDGMRPTDIPQLFRVGTFYHLVVKLLADQSA